jgi:hypothetical protein
MDRTNPARRWRERIVADAKERSCGRYVRIAEPGSGKKQLTRTSFFVVEWLFHLYLYAEDADIPKGMDRIKALEELAPAFVMQMEPTLGSNPAGYPVEVTTGTYNFAMKFVTTTLRAAEKAARQAKKATRAA